MMTISVVINTGKISPFLTTMNQVITVMGMRININNIRTNQTTEESPILFFSNLEPPWRP